MGPLISRFFSINKLRIFLEICDNLKKLDEPCSLEMKKLIRYYCKNTVYNTYTKYVSIDCVIHKASSQQ